MYKTVVFDLDGTLLNTLTDLADAGNRLCRKYGWPTHERQAYRYFVGNGIPKLVERLAPADQRTPAVLEAALADFKRDYGQHLRDTTAPYPGIPEMLAKLKAKNLHELKAAASAAGSTAMPCNARLVPWGSAIASK